MDKELKDKILAFNRKVKADQDKATDLADLIRGLTESPLGAILQLLPKEVRKILEKYGIKGGG